MLVLPFFLSPSPPSTPSICCVTICWDFNPRYYIYIYFFFTVCSTKYLVLKMTFAGFFSHFFFFQPGNSERTHQSHCSLKTVMFLELGSRCFWSCAVHSPLNSTHWSCLNVSIISSICILLQWIHDDSFNEDPWMENPVSICISENILNLSVLTFTTF